MSNKSNTAPSPNPKRRGRALAAFPWVLLACALALFGFAAYVSLRYAEAATGTAGAATGAASGGLWGQFGFLMGGILGPALGFLTVVALAMTLLIQLGAAAEARKEAEADRLEREMRARQAFLGTKLTALTTLVDAANHEIYRTGGSVLMEQREAWEERKKGFLEEMDATFAALQQLDPQLQASAPAEASSAST